MSESEQKKRETLADVVREKRSMAAEIRANLSTVPVRREDQILEAEELDSEADRLEAAWKRERAAILADAAKLGRGKVEVVYSAEKPCGNEAAMREALMTIHDKVNSLDEKCGVDPVEIRDIARAALNKPARNCDMFNDRRSAFEYFRDNELWKYNRGLSAEYWFSEWIFATAEERKGESK